MHKLSVFTGGAVCYKGLHIIARGIGNRIITRSELTSLAHSLYTCIKLYINDCGVMTIETNTH